MRNEECLMGGRYPERLSTREEIAHERDAAESQLASALAALDEARSALAAAESRLAAVTEAASPLISPCWDDDGGDLISRVSSNPKRNGTITFNDLHRLREALAATSTEAAAVAAEGDGTL